MSENFDVIVLGAGGMGSAAAYYLSKANQKVLLLEQFELNHQQGSSYGYSRVIRYSYDNPVYVELMRAAYPLWFALQEEAKETLYVRTGGLDFGLPSQPTFAKLRHSMDRAKLQYEHLTAAEAGDRFPQFQFESGMEALYQHETGLLAASKCVLAHTRCAIERGAIFKDRTPVTEIKVGSDSVEVTTPTETYSAGAIVITAGSWAKQLLERQGIELPLKVMPCQLGFFEPDQPAEYEPGRFPVFFAHMNGDYGEMPYGIPSHDGSGLKVTTFYGWNTVNSPAEVDYTPDPDWIERMRGFIARYIPKANGSLVSTRRCLYTMTPDKDFVIDRHREYPHVVFGAGFSGHGFKFTTLIGSILADLALKGETEHDISLFELERFQTVAV
ncbi:N-methyl-L-tryptophan oxidase [Myxosarcina sp. GI1]|uniref:N-methyl-L-tryptophan oxidase n=1 Tax=Myxosarcina sp. GI1 TaxID=1541065 RepID=UPI00055A7070|nr:N-methyl-L-tryptophan oxidase [Myxosarcina sp. GI1]